MGPLRRACRRLVLPSPVRRHSTEAVLDVITRAVATSPETLRAECEVREAAYLVSGLCIALERPSAHTRMAAERLHALEELIIGRYWWRSN
jgi:HEPN domain-containing protein